MNTEVKENEELVSFHPEVGMLEKVDKKKIEALVVEGCKEAFVSFMKEQDYTKAAKIFSLLETRMDFSHYVKGELSKALDKDDLLQADLLEDAFGEKVDFSEEVTDTVVKLLEKGELNDARFVMENLGRRVNFVATSPDFQKQIVGKFASAVYKADMEKARDIKEMAWGVNLGIDIKRMEDDILDAYTIMLEHGKIYEAVLAKNIGEGIDFSIITEDAFRQYVQQGRVLEAADIMERLGDGTNISNIAQEYTQEINDGYKEALRMGEPVTANIILEKFEGIVQM